MPADSITRVALLTPAGRGAVAVLRVEGPQAAGVLARYFRPAGPVNIERVDEGRIVYGRWGGPSGEECVVALVGPEAIELHCHGGVAAADAVLHDLAAGGVAVQLWSDWTARSKSDPIRAAALAVLPMARTQRTAAIVLDQLVGALGRALTEVRELLSANRTADAALRLDRLLSVAVAGRWIARPARVVLAGRPNVGKSSLLNVLLGYARAIVDPTPGTTRDVVAATTALDGWPIELADTAGRRAAADELESAGIALAGTRAAAADLVVVVTDRSTSWTAEDDALLRQYPSALVVHNKADLAAAVEAVHRPLGVATSASTLAGIDRLASAIVERLVPVAPLPGEAVPFYSQHVEALQAVQTALNAGNAGRAASLLDFR
jgi:tRNA modification GTPase